MGYVKTLQLIKTFGLSVRPRVRQTPTVYFSESTVVINAVLLLFDQKEKPKTASLNNVKPKYR